MKKIFMKKFFKKAVAAVTVLAMTAGMALVPSVEAKADTTDLADAADTVITIYFKPTEDNEEWTWLTHTWGGTVEAKDEENSITNLWNRENPDMVRMTKDEEHEGWYYAEMKAFAGVEGLIWLSVTTEADGEMKLDNSINTGDVWNSAVLMQEPQLTEAYYDQESKHWYPSIEMNSEEAIPMPEVAKDEMYLDFVIQGTAPDLAALRRMELVAAEEESDTNGDTYTLTIEDVEPGDYEYRFVQDPERHAWSYQAGIYASTGAIQISGDPRPKKFTVDATSKVTFTITVTERKGGNDYDKYAMTGAYFEDPIIKKAISSCEITLSEESYDYDGEAKEPTVTVNDENGNSLTANTDYEVEYKNNTDAGTATVTITGIGDYSGTKDKEFRINGTMLSDCIITLPEVEEYTYNGEEQEPIVTVTDDSNSLTIGEDYTVKYENNKNAGTATITITGKGKYEGTETRTFTIDPKNFSGCDITLPADEDYNYTYDGTDKEPTVTVQDGDKELVLDTDYTVEYANNKNVGTATVTITGKGNYTGSKTIEFEIKAKDDEDETEASTSGEDETEASTSGEDETEASTSGEDETEASTSGEDETEASTSGEDETEASTSGEDETEASTSGEDETEASTSGEDETEQTTAEDETEPTTGEPSTEKPPVTQKKTISSCTVTLSAAAYTYDGNAKTPTVTVKDGAKVLKANTDYTVAYKNNTKVGTATVTITGKGNYTGTKTATFKINTAAVKVAQVKSLKQKSSYATKMIKLSWAKVSGATSYEVYRSTSKNKGFKKVATVKTNSLTDKKLKAGTTYYYKVCACNKSVKGAYSSTVKMVTKTATPKVTAKAGKKQIKITWKKVTGAKGYEVSLSTKKNKGFKKIKTAKASATSFTKKGLKKGKIYYVRVKAYNKNAAGKKVYSSTKTVKVKVK